MALNLQKLSHTSQREERRERESDREIIVLLTFPLTAVIRIWRIKRAFEFCLTDVMPLMARTSLCAKCYNKVLYLLTLSVQSAMVPFAAKFPHRAAYTHHFQFLSSTSIFSYFTLN